MKKSHIGMICFTAITLLSVLVGSYVFFISNTNVPNSSVEPEYRIISISGSYRTFNYNELKEEASVIALVTPVDDLTRQNSTVILGEYGELVSYYAFRELEVITYFKENEGDTPDTIGIVESAALTAENEYIQPEGYDFMQKGQRYIVFLTPSNLDGIPIVISAGNGIVPLDIASKNIRTDVAILTLLDLFSDLPQDIKDVFFNSHVAPSILDVNADIISEVVINCTGFNVYIRFYELIGSVRIELSSDITYPYGQLLLENYDLSAAEKLKSLVS